MAEQNEVEGPEQNDEQAPEPQAVVDAAAVDAEDAAASPVPKKPRKKAPAIDRPYPRRTLEDAFNVANAIKTGNNGNPWPPDQVAKALGMGTGSSFFYLTQAARDFGLTEGTRDAAKISLTGLGRKAVFPSSPQDVDAAKPRRLAAWTSSARLPSTTAGATFPLTSSSATPCRRSSDSTPESTKNS